MRLILSLPSPVLPVAGYEGIISAFPNLEKTPLIDFGGKGRKDFWYEWLCFLFHLRNHHLFTFPLDSPQVTFSIKAYALPFAFGRYRFDVFKYSTIFG